MVTSLCPLHGCGHIPALLDYFYALNLHSSTASSKKAWNKKKYNKVNSFLFDIDRDFEFAYLSIDLLFNILLDILKPLINFYLPLRSTDPFVNIFKHPWQLKRDKNRLWA